MILNRNATTLGKGTKREHESSGRETLLRKSAKHNNNIIHFFSLYPLKIGVGMLIYII